MPRIFTPTIRSNSSGCTFSAGCGLWPIPALLMRISIRPNCIIACRTASATPLSDAISASTARACAPNSPATRFAPAASRSTTTTFAPSRTNLRAIASPKPEPAPVIIAVFLSSEPVIELYSPMRILRISRDRQKWFSARQSHKAPRTLFHDHGRSVSPHRKAIQYRRLHHNY